MNKITLLGNCLWRTGCHATVISGVTDLPIQNAFSDHSLSYNASGIYLKEVVMSHLLVCKLPKKRFSGQVLTESSRNVKVYILIE